MVTGRPAGYVKIGARLPGTKLTVRARQFNVSCGARCGRGSSYTPKGRERALARVVGSSRGLTSSRSTAHAEGAEGTARGRGENLRRLDLASRSGIAERESTVSFGGTAPALRRPAHPGRTRGGGAVPPNHSEPSLVWMPEADRLGRAWRFSLAALLAFLLQFSLLRSSRGSRVAEAPGPAGEGTAARSRAPRPLAVHLRALRVRS